MAIALPRPGPGRHGVAARLDRDRLPGPAQVAQLKAHFLLGLLSTMLLVMAHSFIMLFLIATGVEMKDMEKERGWGDSFRRRTIKMKSQVFPAMTFALLLVLANFIMGAVAHTRAVPARVHEGTGLAHVAHLRVHPAARVACARRQQPSHRGSGVAPRGHSPALAWVIPRTDGRGLGRKSAPCAVTWRLRARGHGACIPFPRSLLLQEAP